MGKIMETRRFFLKKSSAAFLALNIPFLGTCRAVENLVHNIPRPETASVIWYSQTGHTQRAGKLIAKTLSESGLKTTASDYRYFDKKLLKQTDLIVAGSPVHYYDVPLNFKAWLAGIPQIQDRPVAAYVTYGGEGGNQYNTSRALAGLLASKGGIPMAAAEFGNMSTFAMTWSMGNHERILEYSHTPDQKSFSQIRQFSKQVLQTIKNSRAMELEKEFYFLDMLKGSTSIWGTRLMISRHAIDKSHCIECGTCIAKCPVNAINLETGKINGDLCILCLGCINNCPAGSVEMVFLGKRVYGFKEFIKQHNINIAEP